MSTKEATEAVATFTERKLPIIWQLEDTRRVLTQGLGVTDEIFLLLYSVSAWAAVTDLIKWTEYGNTSRFRSTLAKLHKDRLVEYDAKNDRAS